MPAASDAQYSDGYLFYARDSVLMARPFDSRGGRFRGEAIATPDRVQYDATTWKANFSLADARLLAYQPMGGRQGSQIRLVDRTGRTIKLLGESGNHFSVHWMPGGRSVVYSSQLVPNSDMFSSDVETGVTRRLTKAVGDEDMPQASPDGRTLAFTSGTRIPGQSGGDYVIVTMPFGAGTTPRVLHDGARNSWPLDWMPDGRSLLVATGIIGAGAVADSMGLLRLDDPGRVQWLPPPPGRFDYAQVSPDGRWVAYGTTGTEDPQVFLDPLPGPNGLPSGDDRMRIQVSTRGGSLPHWRADGRELYYVRADGMAIAVPLEAGTMQPGPEVELFRSNVRFPYMAFDASPDGQRFVVNVLASAGAAPIALVSGWKQGLRAR
jgi:Tol biopolymer transport system component